MVDCLALDAGQADDSEFRVGQPTVFLTIAQAPSSSRVDDLRSSQFPRDYPDVHEQSDSR